MWSCTRSVADAGARRERVEVPRHGLGQAEVVEHRRVEHLRQVAHLLERAVGEPARLAQRLALALGQRGVPPGHRQLDLDGGERLADLVVQLARDGPALVLLHVHQPRRQPLQVARVLGVLAPSARGSGARGRPRSGSRPARRARPATSARPLLIRICRRMPRVDAPQLLLLLRERHAVQFLDALGDPQDDLALRDDLLAQQLPDFRRPPGLVPLQDREHRVPEGVDLGAELAGSCRARRAAPPPARRRRSPG